MVGTAAARDTIFALSSGSTRCAVAVVRISGPASDATLRQLMRGTLPPPRTATLASLVYGGTLLDRALVMRFPGPQSFTGEDCAELHLHGSIAVVRAVLDTLRAMQLRPAEPGEFTRRAFDAGKLDLTQVEGLADLMAAETESQRKQSLLHSSGAVRRQHEAWRQTLLTCLARLEAVVDFGEEEGIDLAVAAGVLPLVRTLRGELEGHLASAVSGELIRSGVRIAIVGRPNSGKSSLVNLLAGHEAAIVSPIPGTTRDLVEVPLELGGVKVILTDTAGLRQTDCAVEAEGVRRARNALQQAHVVLSLGVAGAGGVALGGGEQGNDVQALAGPLPEGALHIRVENKADLLPQSPALEEAACTGREVPPAAGGASQEPLLISCKSGQGMDQLLATLQQAVCSLVSGSGNGTGTALVTRARHRHHLAAVVAALQRYEAVGPALELGCEELRIAARELGAVTGAIQTEQLLDKLFSEFCIGK
ncbi:hypothetical protein D9Q98_002536 [Chlorella vulgaris]|uniref:TrmE-type G domain-containing protein n=1 Tax=Chlorella vulgaris TaxID=3077 RepID=A0A9D4TTX2_CHLVU|nr:hypothetical protein D9Q98_002536 [Chlorella vulgaris]